MRILSPFKTPREACYRVGELAELEMGKLAHRPWNQYEPDTSPWWLVPATDWPAYRYGKYFFDYANKPDGHAILSGLYVEKGLDPSIRELYRSAKGSRLIMSREWTWFRLLKDMENGVFQQTIQNLGRDLGLTIEFRIDGGHVPDPDDFVPTTPRLPWNTYLLRWIPGYNTFELVESRKESYLLDALCGVRTFNDLLMVLRELDTNRWLWVDFFVALRLYTPQDEKDGTAELVWGANDLWKNFLVHLSRWVV